MTDTSLPGLSRSLTTTEAALIDLERQEIAMAERRRILLGNDPAIPPAAADGARTDPYDAETLDALTRPVRIEIVFDGGALKVREQIDALLPALQELRTETYRHERGLARQLIQLRHIAKVAADVLTYMNGKTPTGKKKRTPQ